MGRQGIQPLQARSLSSVTSLQMPLHLKSAILRHCQKLGTFTVCQDDGMQAFTRLVLVFERQEGRPSRRRSLPHSARSP